MCLGEWTVNVSVVSMSTGKGYICVWMIFSETSFSYLAFSVRNHILDVSVSASCSTWMRPSAFSGLALTLPCEPSCGCASLQDGGLCRVPGNGSRCRGFHPLESIRGAVARWKMAAWRQREKEEGVGGWGLIQLSHLSSPPLTLVVLPLFTSKLRLRCANRAGHGAGVCPESQCRQPCHSHFSKCLWSQVAVGNLLPAQKFLWLLRRFDRHTYIKSVCRNWGESLECNLALVPRLPAPNPTDGQLLRRLLPGWHPWIYLPLWLMKGRKSERGFTIVCQKTYKSCTHELSLDQ